MRISSLHVVDGEGRYLGPVRVQDLAVADPEQRLRELITAVPTSVTAMAPRAEVVELLEKYHLPSLPVVDFQQGIRVHLE
jgi:Mg/Co/Ni transporter MgtE